MNYTPESERLCKKELSSNITKQHVLACKVAVVINTAWSVVNYLIFTENQLVYLIGGIGISVVISLALILREKWNISGELLGMIPMTLIGVFFTFIYSQLPVPEFQKFTFLYVAMFLGAGMFLLWHIRYSIATVIIILSSAGLFFTLFGSLSFEQIMINGGILSLSMAFFMIISIQTRYQIITKEILAKTALIKKQNELIKAKKVAENSRELQSQFLSHMSHEIRTPMNGVLGMARLLRGTNQTKEQKKYTDAIYSSADNLMLIINDILDFSKIEAGKVVLEKVSFNIRERLNTLYDILTLKTNEKNISLQFLIDDNVPDWLIGDPVRLSQVILNLTSNAIKFTEEGEVIVTINAVTEKNDQITLHCRVKDTGVGIPQNKLHNIFSSFTQASSSTTREYGGTGLGLTISKQLIELQGGNMFVESEEGKGSTFGFSVKYQVDTENEDNIVQKSVQTEDVISPLLENLKVLLVEDHEINQMLAITVLEGWDFKVDLAENGEEAVAKVQEGEYDIVLMDIHMPIMDGYEATKQIRASKKSDIPIVAMTASALIGDNQKCFDVGMDDYISKPFDPELLLEKITFQINKN